MLVRGSFCYADRLNLETFLNLLLAVALGALVGVEREITHKPAGLRTHMLVSLGAALFTIVSISFGIDPARISAGIVAGIGFIGAGAIWAEQDKVKGITTAASLWATAAIGLTAGVGDYPLAAVVTALVVIILASNILLKKTRTRKRINQQKINSIFRLGLNFNLFLSLS